MEKLSSTKLVPGAKKVGYQCRPTEHGEEKPCHPLPNQSKSVQGFLLPFKNIVLWETVAGTELSSKQLSLFPHYCWASGPFLESAHVACTTSCQSLQGPPDAGALAHAFLLQVPEEKKESWTVCAGEPRGHETLGCGLACTTWPWHKLVLRV